MTTLSAMSAPGTVVRFLTELRSTGAPVIRLRSQETGLEALLLLESEAARAPEVSGILASWHREAAENLGGSPLSFDEAAALHGARLLFRAAWCYLQRDIGKDEVTRLLQSPLPSPPTAAAQFSADLTLQHQPAIFRMAQTLSPGDPLLGALQSLAVRFPLSGVGIAAGRHDLPDPDTLPVIFGHQGLRQLFLDRILATRARDWLHHPQVAEALQQTLGSHAQTLAPGFEIQSRSLASTGPPPLPEPPE